jgi:uncharacterized protein
MKFKWWFGAVLCAISVAAAAQGAASAPSSPAKKALVAKVLQLQQTGAEAFARNIVQQNAMQVLQAANTAVQQRVAADRREAVWRDIQADARKFADEAFPILREQAIKLLPATVGPLIEERFTEDELKQLVGVLESPVGRKFASMNGEMLRRLGERLMADARPAVEPKMTAFQQTIASRLNAPAAPASGASR